METVALEFVPPTIDDGVEKAQEEVLKALELAGQSGIGEHIGHLMIPGMIEEDPDRPVELKPRLDTLDTWRAAREAAPHLKGLCTQVTAFLDQERLSSRFSQLLDAGVEGVIFVGVPRTMQDGEGTGVAPTDALEIFRGQVPNRGAILIPTREGELGRFSFKCQKGANFALTQLLYSDSIVRFLEEFSKENDHRPEVLLSFGFVPKVETKVELIRWLIQDPGNPLAESEQRTVARLAEASPQEKRQELVELYRNVVDGVRALGFPVSIHFETPYGFSRPALDTLAEMLAHWAPGGDRR